jgi:hypothetical protein
MVKFRNVAVGVICAWVLFVGGIYSFASHKDIDGGTAAAIRDAGLSVNRIHGTIALGLVAIVLAVWRGEKTSRVNRYATPLPESLLRPARVGRTRALVALEPCPINFSA